MSFETKTIICKAEEFDKKFKEWKNQWQKTVNSYQYISKIVLTHDGDNHYILYSTGFSFPKNTQD
jgi:hypothetical protein